MMRVLTALPDLPQQRVILNPLRGPLSVVIPVARTNLITNPSFETATTGWTASGGSIARSTTQQYHGAYSLAVTPTSGTSDGVYFGTVSLTSGTTYAASIKVYGAAGVPYKISIATTGGVDLASYAFTGIGRWQWVWVYYTETSSTTRRVYVTKNSSASTAVFYIDGAQVEAITAGETVSTYIDGDQPSLLAAGQFPPPYGWNGARHASTSYRTAQARDGGMVKNFDAFKFFLTGLVGLGLTSPSHIVAQGALSDGATYQTSTAPSRELIARGRFNTRSPIDRDLARSALGQTLGLDAVTPRQPIALVYQAHEGTTPAGEAGKIIASYKDGLGGDQAAIVGEDADATFVQWLPFVLGHDGGATLDQSATIETANVSNLLYRDADGVWANLSEHVLADAISDIVRHPDGTYYLTGTFTSIGGTAANHIARYDPVTNTFSALGTGLASGGTPIGSRLWVAPDGNVWVAGAFTTANGVTVNNITYWNGTTFVAIGGGTKGVDDWAQAVVGDASGNVYITGRFLNAGGAAANRIVRWTGSAFATLGTGLDDFGFALAMGLDGETLYVGGTFATANGVTVNNIALWDGTTFDDLDTGVVGDVHTVLTAPNGDIYAVGSFTATVGGLTVNRVARWNGAGWSALGQGVTSGSTITRAAFAADGLLYIAGTITAVDGITTADGFAAWNGSAWILPDVDMAGAPSGNAIGVGARGELLVYFYNGTASDGAAAATTTLTNTGTARTYPTLIITGPSSSTSRLHQLRSYTTGAIVSFNLTIFANEIITVTAGPDAIGVTSNMRGDLSQYVLPGSAPELALMPGANVVAILVAGGTVTIDAHWPRRFQAGEDLTYGAT